MFTAFKKCFFERVILGEYEETAIRSCIRCPKFDTENIIIETCPRYWTAMHYMFPVKKLGDIFLLHFKECFGVSKSHKLVA